MVDGILSLKENKMGDNFGNLEWSFEHSCK
mgnify:CR=1 FL=1